MSRSTKFISFFAIVLIASFFFLTDRKPHPIYETKATLLLEPKWVNGVVPDKNTATKQFDERLEKLGSIEFQKYVVRSFTPEELEFIRAPYLDSKNSNSGSISVEAIIRDNLKVERSKQDPAVVEIVCSHRKPEAATLIANRYARQFIKFDRDPSGKLAEEKGLVIGGGLYFSSIKVLERANIPKTPKRASFW